MIKLDISKSNVTEKQVKKLEKKLLEIHSLMISRKGEGAEMTDWLSWPTDHYKGEMETMLDKVKELKEQLKVEKLLVIGIGGSYLGAKAAVDMINGVVESADDIIFAGINMSTSYYKQVERQLEGKKWAIAAISKSGTTLEPALAFRHFKSLLAKEVSKEDLPRHIIAVTDKEKGALKKEATQEGYTTLSIPDGIGGRFSGITAVGLLPLAFAGIDVKALLKGAEKASQDLLKQPNNDAFTYAAIRHILGKKKEIEIFTSYDPDLMFMGEWWKQLFGESEGKDGKGLYPASANYSADLHSLGQYIQEGKRNMLETTLWVNENEKIFVKKDSLNADNLNYLANEDISVINEKAFRAVVEAHHQGGNPQVIIEIDKKDAETLGYLWYFFFISVTVSGYLLGVNPFDQPGVELYKALMFKNLGKPE